MKPPTEKLLDDLMDEAAPPEFRAALLDQTLRQARRRRRVRQGTLVLVTVAATFMLASAFWDRRASDQPVAASHPDSRPSLNVVQTRPFQPSQIVSTDPNSVNLAAASGSIVRVVETADSRTAYGEINDQQLLDLFSGRHVTLVRHEPNQAELIFLNPEDRKEFFGP